VSPERDVLSPEPEQQQITLAMLPAGSAAEQQKPAPRSPVSNTRSISMHRRNLLLGLGLLPLMAIALPAETPPAKPPQAADQVSRPSKLDLTPESFPKFRDLVRPAGHEWQHLKIKWYTDIVAARKKAAQEDKPLLVFNTGGAGYNDTLGVC
jgi:hypothetical protein